MARLGDLERSVMDVLWDRPAGLTGRDVLDALNAARRADGSDPLAYTTVLTVLDRLQAKGFVSRERAKRVLVFRAASGREDVVAEAMLEALGTAGDRHAALVRFVGAVSEEEAALLAAALERAERARRAD